MTPLEHQKLVFWRQWYGDNVFGQCHICYLPINILEAKFEKRNELPILTCLHCTVPTQIITDNRTKKKAAPSHLPKQASKWTSEEESDTGDDTNSEYNLIDVDDELSRQMRRKLRFDDSHQPHRKLKFDNYPTLSTSLGELCNYIPTYSSDVHECSSYEATVVCSDTNQYLFDLGEETYAILIAQLNSHGDPVPVCSQFLPTGWVIYNGNKYPIVHYNPEY